MISRCLVRLMLGWTAAVPVTDQALVTTLPSTETPTYTSPVADTKVRSQLWPYPLCISGEPEVYSLHVTSHIQYRYASSIVSSKVANTANTSKEVVFSVVIPDTAFISGFLMEIEGKVYKASVKEKEAAKKEYEQAISAGQTAGHVAQSARNSNRFTVSVNIESQKKITFNLTYEELLKRELSVYNHIINIDPGQIVQDMAVEVNINESSPITTLEVSNLRESNEVDNEKSSNNSLAEINRPSNNTATILWAPTEEDQRQLNEEGVKGQVVVRYDVDRTSNPEQILVDEGYFVHFFSPADLPTLRKHVTFIMDVSGSMDGRKIEQLREAMKITLDDLNSGDYFSLIIFSFDVQVWDPDHELVLPRPWFPWTSQETMAEQKLRDAAVVQASPENIKKAHDFVNNLQSYSSTNIYGALLKGLDVAHLGKKLIPGDAENKPEPIIIFLTDGEANVGESDPEKIVGIVTDKNGVDGVSIFALEFGDYANSQFLKKLSLRNSGFSRKIYEASDSALQLRDFYRLVASPLLAKVRFNYPEDQVEEGTLSRTNFSTFFRGSELVVSGKLRSSELTGHLTANTAEGSYSMSFRHPVHMPSPNWWLAARHRPERNYSDSSFMERLWAYLTIQQLLEKETAETLEGSNFTSPSKEKALDLALKYGFVTPVTSLVVVKPNETFSTDTEKGDVSGVDYSNPLYGYSGSHQAAFAASSFADGSFAALPQHLPPPPPPPPPPPALAPMYPQTYPPRPVAMPFLISAVPLSTFQPLLSAVIPVQDLTWLAAMSNSSHVTLQPDPSSPEETFQLGLNQTDEAFSSCSSPEGAGQCRYLTHCALNTFADNVAQFYPYFCRIDTYVGVCCPNSLKPVAVVD